MFKQFGRPLVFFDGDDKGGGGSSDPNQKDNAPAGGGNGLEVGSALPDGTKLTQEKIDKWFGDTRKQGREALSKEIVEKTGLKSVDDVYAAIDAYNKAETDKLSAVDKANKIATDAQAANDKLAKELRETRFERDFDRTILKLDLEFQNDKARDVALKLLDIETAGKGIKEMEDAVNGLVKEHAYLFTEAEAAEIDATQRGKTDKNVLKKEIVQEKQKSGKYQVV